MKTLKLILCTLSALLLATPAFANEANGDSLTIGIGAVSVPRYEGSAHDLVIPAAAGYGSVGGYTFAVVGGTVYTDVIRKHKDEKSKFILGPVLHIGLDRSSISFMGNPQLASLGRLGPSVNLGAQIGYQTSGVLTSKYDQLGLTVTAYQDVGNVDKSYVIAPSILYAAPLSHSLLVGANISADYVGGGYARTFFGITPAQSTASGYPVTNIGAGWQEVSAGGLIEYSLSHNLKHGLGLVAFANHEWLLGSFARSPTVESASLWSFGTGVAYSF